MAETPEMSAGQVSLGATPMRSATIGRDVAAPVQGAPAALDRDAARAEIVPRLVKPAAEAAKLGPKALR